MLAAVACCSSQQLLWEGSDGWLKTFPATQQCGVNWNISFLLSSCTSVLLSASLIGFATSSRYIHRGPRRGQGVFFFIMGERASALEEYSGFKCSGSVNQRVPPLSLSIYESISLK